MKYDVKLVIVGAGKWGMKHVQTAAKLGSLHTVYDTNADCLHRASSSLFEEGLQAPLVSFTSRWSDVASCSATAAVVATPPSTHCEIACELLRCGKDVLVEKPVGLSVDEAAKLRDLARDLGRILMAGHLLHFTPLHLGLKQVLSSGIAGNITRIHAQRKNMGTVRLEEDVIWSIGPHDVSLVLSLAGDKRVCSVSCTGQSVVTSGIVDSATMVLSFGNDTKAIVEVSWLHPEKKREIMVYGSKGCLHLQETVPDDQALTFRSWAWNLEGEDSKMRVKTSLGTVEPVGIIDRSTPPLEAEVVHFLSCCQSRKTPITSADEGVQVVEVLCAASQSLRAGGAPVNIMKSVSRAYFAHPMSCVDEGAVVGAGSKIWHFTHILSGAVIGSNTSLGQNVSVGSKAKIGSNVKIQNNVSIYDEVTIEDDVFLGPSCVFTNVRTPRAFVSRRLEFVPTLVKKGATIGANATILCGNKIGQYAMVGAGAVVTRDVAAYSLVVGSPAIHIDWVSECGLRLRPYPIGSDDCSDHTLLGALQCPSTGSIFETERKNDSIVSVRPLVGRAE